MRDELLELKGRLDNLLDKVEPKNSDLLDEIQGLQDKYEELLGLLMSIGVMICGLVLLVALVAQFIKKRLRPRPIFIRVPEKPQQDEKDS